MGIESVVGNFGEMFMEWTRNRKWFAIALIGIIAPISLLTAFKMAGIIFEPQTPIIIQQEPVLWSMERPSHTLEAISENIENAYVDELIAAKLRLHIFTYRENPNPLWAPWFGRDTLIFAAELNVSALNISNISLKIKYLMDANSTLYFYSEFLYFHNVTVTEIKNPSTYGREGYVTAEISSLPCYLKVQADWVFSDLNILDHYLDVISEVTYYNGTAYLKAAIPINLQMLISTSMES